MNERYTDRLPVKPAARRLAGVLVDMPLASSRDLAGVLEKGAPQLHSATTELEREGLVSHVELGSTLKGTRKARRWFFTQKAVELFDGLPLTGHEEGNRAVKLNRIQILEWFYRIAGTWQTMGEVREFRWVDSGSLEAAVKYADGWIALCWSGVLETEGEITARFHQLAIDVDVMAREDASPWPGAIFFVVPDQWQGDLVKRAAAQFRLDHNVAIWRISDGVHTGPEELRVSRGWVHKPVALREIGDWGWDDRVNRAIWSQDDAPSLYRVFRVIAEHPGISQDLIRRSIGGHPAGNVVDRACRSLVRLDLAQTQTVPGERGLRYCLTSSGMDRFAMMERGTWNTYRDRVMHQSWVHLPRRRTHEDLVTAFIGVCKEAGVMAVPGWRYYENMGSLGAIAPDGILELVDSPFGPGQAYLEWERSARFPKRVGEKLRGYAALVRRDDRPVLVVCRDDRAEATFHEVAGEVPIPMLTATEKRLDDYGPLGNYHTWSFYGHMVKIC